MASATLGTGAVRELRPERAGLQSQDSGIEVTLGKGSIWCGKASGRCRVIKCLEGAIWITQERDLQDYILRAGEAFLVSRPGKIAVQAMRDARVKIAPAATTGQ